MTTTLRWLGAALATGGVLVLSCTWLLPERFAVNAPVGHLLFGMSPGSPPVAVARERLQAAHGLGIELFADGIAGARFLRFTPTGDLLVSQPRQGRVWLVRADGNGDGRSEGAEPILEDLSRPHGLDLLDEWLYVAESDRILRVRFDAEARRALGTPEPVVAGLPGGGNHWTRTLRFGPDGWMYVSVGSSCNVCEEEDPRRAALLRFRPDGSDPEIFASGLRNAVGFDWQPGTGDLYATDNGRDLLGDDFPPCELNLVERDAFYGWPYVNGDGVPDPDFGDRAPQKSAAARSPAFGFPAHNAPLGMTFVRSGDAPAALHGTALVALHGSWNRSEKDGYKVVSLHWEPDGTIRSEDLAWGFERDGDVIGRPVDVAEGPDGALYVSDDFAGAIWRIATPDAGVLRAGPGEDGLATPPPLDPLASLSKRERRTRASRGEALYEEMRCFRCHEVDRAEEGVVPVDLQGLGSRRSLAEVVSRIATPVPPMPLYDLAEAERRDLAVHLLQRFP